MLDENFTSLTVLGFIERHFATTNGFYRKDNFTAT